MNLKPLGRTNRENVFEPCATNIYFFAVTLYELHLSQFHVELVG